MIGYWDYTVVLTYLSLAVSIVGIFFATGGHLGTAVLCLACSGLLDTFDGKVARTKKDRTEEQKNFGIQIDSLCDMTCFGVAPVIICWYSGMQGIPSVIILVTYCLCGLVRLAYFNVMAESGKQESSNKRKFYRGLCTDPKKLDQISNDWRSVFLCLNILLNLKRKWYTNIFMVTSVRLLLLKNME